MPDRFFSDYSVQVSALIDGRDLNYDKVEGGNPDVAKMEEYHSHNTRRLNVEERKELLHKLTFIREDLGLQPRAKAKEIRSE